MKEYKKNIVYFSEAEVVEALQKAFPGSLKGDILKIKLEERPKIGHLGATTQGKFYRFYDLVVEVNPNPNLLAKKLKIKDNQPTESE